jgi:hypothetical protein
LEIHPNEVAAKTRIPETASKVVGYVNVLNDSLECCSKSTSTTLALMREQGCQRISYNTKVAERLLGQLPPHSDYDLSLSGRPRRSSNEALFADNLDR